MAGEFDDPLRSEVIELLTSVVGLVEGLTDDWMGQTEPGLLLDSARALRERSAGLVETVEKLWPNLPPPEYSG